MKFPGCRCSEHCLWKNVLWRVARGKQERVGRHVQQERVSPRDQHQFWTTRALEHGTSAGPTPCCSDASHGYKLPGVSARPGGGWGRMWTVVAAGSECSQLRGSNQNVISSHMPQILHNSCYLGHLPPPHPSSLLKQGSSMCLAKADLELMNFHPQSLSAGVKYAGIIMPGFTPSLSFLRRLQLFSLLLTPLHSYEPPQNSGSSQHALLQIMCAFLFPDLAWRPLQNHQSLLKDTFVKSLALIGCGGTHL